METKQLHKRGASIWEFLNIAKYWKRTQLTSSHWTDTLGTGEPIDALPSVGGIWCGADDLVVMMAAAGAQAVRPGVMSSNAPLPVAAKASASTCVCAK